MICLGVVGGGRGSRHQHFREGKVFADSCRPETGRRSEGGESRNVVRIDAWTDEPSEAPDEWRPLNSRRVSRWSGGGRGDRGPAGTYRSRPRRIKGDEDRLVTRGPDSRQTPTSGMGPDMDSDRWPTSALKGAEEGAAISGSLLLPLQGDG